MCKLHDKFYNENTDTRTKNTSDIALAHRTYAWSIPMKDKTGITTLNVFKQIVKASGRIPKYIWVDQGKEFYNKNVDEWLKENNITKYSTFGEHKSCVVERFNKTLKQICGKDLLRRIQEIG